MAINCVVWGLTGRDTGAIPRAMRQRSEFGTVVWFGIWEDCDRNMYETYRFQPDYDYSVGLPRAYMDIMFDAMGQFLISCARRNECKIARTTWTLGFGTTYGYIHQFNRYCYLIHELITKNKINLVVIDSVPHTGFDVLLCQATKYFKIKTIYLYQSGIPNKFLYFTELRRSSVDFSVYYTEKRPVRSKVSYTVADPETPFFMRDFSHLNYSYDRFADDLAKEGADLETRNGVGGPGVFGRLFGHNRYSWKGFLELLRATSSNNLGRLENIASAFLKSVKAERYYRSLELLSQNKIEGDTPFVYFPLSTQPEITTECLADQYMDIVTAVEKIRCLIPDHWMICVKEHVLQYELGRDPIFFDRLTAIPNLVMVDRSASAYDLIKTCKFVATINGTSGWEALHFAKSVVNFGSFYYNGLPGVLVYDDELTLEDVLGAEPDPEILGAAIEELVGRMEDGVVNADYSEIVDDYDDDENAKSVADVICRVFYDESENTEPTV